MEENYQKSFEALLGDIVLPIILNDETIVKFMKDNDITDRKPALNIGIWLGCATIGYAFRNQKGEEAEYFVEVSKRWQKDAEKGLSEDFDGIGEILTDILIDNFDEWSAKIAAIMKKKMSEAQQPTSNKSKRLILKKKPEVKADTNEIKLTPKQIKQAADMQIKCLKEIILAEKGFSTLAKKYAKAPKAKLAEYMGILVMMTIMSMIKAKKLTQMEPFKKHADDMVKCATEKGQVLSATLTKCLGQTKMKQFDNDNSNFISKNISSILLKYAQAMQNIADKLNSK